MNSNRIYAIGFTAATAFFLVSLGWDCALKRSTPLKMDIIAVVFYGFCAVLGWMDEND